MCLRTVSIVKIAIIIYIYVLFILRFDNSEIIRILHECQVWIDKFVPMPNCDPRDRFVYPYLTRMMDSFSCTL